MILFKLFTILTIVSLLGIFILYTLELFFNVTNRHLTKIFIATCAIMLVLLIITHLIITIILIKAP